MTEKICLSCKIRTVNDRGTTTFKCPKCSNYEITRCSHCRSSAIKFTCPNCGFIGPN